MDFNKLIDLAIAAKDNSYSPYSHFRVGCALVLKDGNYITGSNIENASYGATNCAERSAIFAAYSQGYTKEDIIGLAVTSDMPEAVPPCCICRQVMVELLNHEIPILMVGQNRNYTITNVQELVPFQFTETELKTGQKN